MGVAGEETGVAIIHPMLSDSCTKLAKQQAARKGAGEGAKGECSARHMQRDRQLQGHAAKGVPRWITLWAAGQEGGKGEREGREGGCCLLALSFWH